MSNFRPDISQLYNAAFQLRQPVYAAQTAERQTELDLPFSGVTVVSAPEGQRLSMYGHPLLFPFSFKQGTYKRFNVRGELEEFKLPDFELPASTLVDFSRAKKIVSTESSGLGTVKELYGIDDWNIKIRGFCLLDTRHPNAKTAQEQKMKLLEWESVAGHIEISGGDLFTEKKIFALVIEQFSVSQISGYPDMIPFEMSCRSDTPFSLSQQSIF